MRTHVTRHEFKVLNAAADSRATTLSKILRSLVTAFVRNERLELPQPRGTSSAAIRELASIGNNLNQLTRQANGMMVPVSATRLNAVLDQVLAAVTRLG